MPTKLRNLSKYRNYLIYWLLIAALGGYLVYDHCTDYQEYVAPVLKNSIDQGRQSAERFNQQILMRIHRYADGYRISQNEAWRREAKAAREQVSACQKMIKILADNHR